MSVGIVGTGISGLTLALRLQQLGVEVTVYADTTTEQQRGGRLPNTVGRFEHTLARERTLGISHAPYTGWEMSALHIHTQTDPPLRFRGDSTHPVQSVDFRVLLPQFRALFEERGGRVVVTGSAPSAEDVVRWSDHHEVVVVGVGRRSLSGLFPADPARSPLAAPQRRLFAGLFVGLGVSEPRGFGYCAAPGVGEIFQLATWTASGPGTSLLVEAIPGGPLAELEHVDYAENRDGFLRLLRELLARYAPPIADRIEDTFDLRAPEDLLQGAIRPVVRRAWSELGNGRLALAIGDAWISNDPITGQGANLGSHNAWTMAEAIAAGGPFDVEFGRRVEQRMWEFAEPVTAWTNIALGPFPKHMGRLLAAAGQHKRIADGFFDLYNDPVRMWALFSDPARAEKFCASGMAGRSGHR